MDAMKTSPAVGADLAVDGDRLDKFARRYSAAQDQINGLPSPQLSPGVLVERENAFQSWVTKTPSDDRASSLGELTNPLRIAMALPGIHRVARGAETAFEQIGRELARLGHDVTLFGSGPAPRNEPYHYIQVACIGRERFEGWPSVPGLRSHYAWEELTFAPGLWSRFRPDEFDITLACSYPLMNWLLRRGPGRHVFVTQNGDWMLRARNAEYRWFGCDGLVCTNPQFFQRHRSSFRSALIPNGVSPEIFCPGNGDRAAYGLPAGVPIALMVSALIPSKRVEEGIRAVAAVKDLFLVVAGDGECRANVDRLAGELLPGRFRRLTLPRERMPGLYRRADVFLHLSRDEPSANAYMEALATGLPIVTHDWEVTRWTLGDTGVLVDGADEAAVVAGLRRSLELKTPADIAKRCERARERFAWSSIGRQYSDFFQKVLDAPAWVSSASRFPPEAESAESVPNEMQSERDDAPATAKGAPGVLDGQETGGERSLVRSQVGVVAIARNEGPRLIQCLQSVLGTAAAVVYVDSGSDDGSVEAARELGAEVVRLDTTMPFTAARARNAGFDRLLTILPDLPYVQFVDGDCQVRAGWLDRAVQVLEANQKLAGVCGRRRERFPERSIYNRLIDLEWDTPVGPAKSVGGDALFRTQAFRQVGGFDPTVMAGEEPQLCLRLRHAGWQLRRIDGEMTWHDAAITRLGQWWRRQARGGYGALDVCTRFQVGGERLFVKQTRSTIVWTIVWPAIILAAGALAGIVGGWKIGLLAAAVVALGLPLQMARMALAARRRKLPLKLAIAHGFFTLFGKWPCLMGQMSLWRDRAGGKIRLIEYKRGATRPAPGPSQGRIEEVG